LVHNAEVYFGISTECLQILIDDVNAYTNENRDVLKRAQSLSDLQFQSRYEHQKTLFQVQVSVHHKEQFGRLEARFDDVRSGCLRRAKGVCL